jgi:hypothetical protein
MLLSCQLIGHVVIIPINWLCCYHANQLVMLLSRQLIGYVVLLSINWLCCYPNYWTWLQYNQLIGRITTFKPVDHILFFWFFAFSFFVLFRINDILVRPRDIRPRKCRREDEIKIVCMFHILKFLIERGITVEGYRTDLYFFFDG